MTGGNSSDKTLNNLHSRSSFQTALILGAAFDSRPDKSLPFVSRSTAYETGISPIRLTCNNNTGNTILEITNPDELRYCFMFSPAPSPFDVMDMTGGSLAEHSLGEDEVDEEPRCRPLGPEEYLSYPSVGDRHLDVDLGQWRLVTQDTLREL